MLSEVLPYLELTKDNETEEDKRSLVEVPNIEGMTVIEAIKKLKEVGLELQIQDAPENLDKKAAIVIEQLPKSSITVYEGTKIITKVQ